MFAAGYGGATMAYDLAMLPTKSNKGNELMRIAQNSPIAGLRNIADTAIYLDTGDVINARGYTVVKDVGTGATVMRFLGFYPKEASRVNDAIRITKRIVDNQKEITKSFRDEWVRAFLMKDRRAMRDIERAVKEHNSVHGKKSPFFIDDFRGKARLNRNAEERDAKTWATPVIVSTNKSLQSKLIASGLETDAQMARLLEIPIPSHRLFTKDSSTGRKIYNLINSNYGEVGQVYVNKLMELGSDVIQGMIEQATNDFQGKYKSKFTGEERYGSKLSY